MTSGLNGLGLGGIDALGGLGGGLGTTGATSGGWLERMVGPELAPLLRSAQAWSSNGSSNITQMQAQARNLLGNQADTASNFDPMYLLTGVKPQANQNSALLANILGANQNPLLAAITGGGNSQQQLLAALMGGGQSFGGIDSLASAFLGSGGTNGLGSIFGGLGGLTGGGNSALSNYPQLAVLSDIDGINDLSEDGLQAVLTKLQELQQGINDKLKTDLTAFVQQKKVEEDTPPIEVQQATV